VQNTVNIQTNLYFTADLLVNSTELLNTITHKVTMTKIITLVANNAKQFTVNRRWQQLKHINTN